MLLFLIWTCCVDLFLNLRKSISDEFDCDRDHRDDTNYLCCRLKLMISKSCTCSYAKAVAGKVLFRNKLFVLL